jgi:formate-dependent nitrite reductase membrane component NrfD
VLLVVFVATLGVLARGYLGGIGAVVLWGGVAVLGLLVPLALHLRPRLLGGSAVAVAAVLSLVGGFLLRYAVVMLPQGYLG